MRTSEHTQQVEAGLIQSIYQLADSTISTPTFLHKLVESLDGRSARLLQLNATADKVISSVKVNIDDAYHQQYVDYYVNKCPWRPELASKPKGRLYSSYLDFSCRQPEYLKTEFYNDWARPQNIEHGICGTIVQHKAKTFQLLVQRTGAAGHFLREETDFVNRLIPHLSNAFTFAAKINQMKLEQSAVSQAAEKSSLPFLLLDESARTSFVSGSAEQFIAQIPQLSIRAGSLVLKQASLNDRLQALVRSVIKTAQGKGNGAGGITNLEVDNSAVNLSVMPLCIESKSIFATERQSFASVFFSSPELKTNISITGLMRHFELTHREAIVASMLCNGMSIEQIAEENKVKVATVRSQLKSIFFKTATTRQGELVAKLFTSAAAIKD